MWCESRWPFQGATPGLMLSRNLLTSGDAADGPAQDQPQEAEYRNPG